MKRAACVVAILTMMFAGASLAQDDKTQAAQSAAEAWLKVVDSGNYPQSWDDASSAFKQAVTQKDWEKQIKMVRGPLGEVTSRKLKGAKYTTQLPGAPDGEYVVIQYDSSFANKKSAVETVTPKLDKDGNWRVSGYFIR